MKPCRDYEETLFLDVYGELSETERPAWERHLEECEGCLQERERLCLLLEGIREALPSPALSQRKAMEMADSIKRILRREQEKTWWKKRVWVFPNRLIPALAAACLVVVAVGWLSLRGYKPSSSFRPISNLNPEERTLKKDLEVIKNLELLEEMEVIEKLIRVVDDRKTL